MIPAAIGHTGHWTLARRTHPAPLSNRRLGRVHQGPHHPPSVHAVPKERIPPQQLRPQVMRALCIITPVRCPACQGLGATTHGRPARRAQLNSRALPPLPALHPRLHLRGIEEWSGKRLGGYLCAHRGRMPGARRAPGMARRAGRGHPRPAMAGLARAARLLDVDANPRSVLATRPLCTVTGTRAMNKRTDAPGPQRSLCHASSVDPRERKLLARMALGRSLGWRA